jgi:hypothetical protein
MSEVGKGLFTRPVNTASATPALTQRVRTSFTLRPDIITRLRAYCERDGVMQYGVVERALRELLDRENV